MATEAVFKRRHVHKFGGSSLADPVCYRRVASIVEQQVGGNELVVVSAAGKTTNRLIQLVELAEAGDEAAGEAITALHAYQQSLIDGLLEGELHLDLSQQLTGDMQLIAKTLEGQFDRFERNGLLAFGEVWSARLLAALLTSRGEWPPGSMLAASCAQKTAHSSRWIPPSPASCSRLGWPSTPVASW